MVILYPSYDIILYSLYIKGEPELTDPFNLLMS